MAYADPKAVNGSSAYPTTLLTDRSPTEQGTDHPASIRRYTEGMEATLQNILQHRFDAYAEQHRQPLHKHKAVSSIRQCRTAALGGHVQSCPEGHIEKIWYNSCKHRSCPKCCALPTERWLESQQAKLLDAIITTLFLPYRINFWTCGGVIHGSWRIYYLPPPSRH